MHNINHKDPGDKPTAHPDLQHNLSNYKHQNS